ncbi:MAG: hypothetical protein IPH32_00090 [Bacteroidetes bacterium]|nr:hypothetical protein [Bacteroidota bacterium]
MIGFYWTLLKACFKELVKASFTINRIGKAIAIFNSISSNSSNVSIYAVFKEKLLVTSFTNSD